jgi:peptidoglycan hydrolase-like protein with peptidoglycan-binding domain
VARTSPVDSLALLDRLAPDEAVPDWAWQGRDLTEHELWELSMQRSLTRRQAHANRPKLPQARKAGVALAVAAVAAAATPAKGAPRAGSGSSSGQVEELLHVGSRGPAVRALQRQLGVPPDGMFGPQTKRAVRSFQKRHGLAPDGVVGPLTRAALAGGGAHAGPRIIRAWWVAPVQRKLGVTVDGAYGPESRAAVRRYQAGHGLAVDGIVGPQTLRALGLSGGGGGHSGGTRIIRAWWVAPVQRKLGVPVDGAYGPVTRRAVKRFQERHGLVVDGIVGPQTLAALGIRRPSGSSHGGGGGGGGGGGAHASSRAPTAVAAARSALGRPYAWGGNGPSSFDCSGLMVWAWRQAGVTLPRTSYAQYLAGRPVSRSNVRAGDLVFFATNGPGASHVGIAISGSSFISATTRGVRVQPIGGSYWGSTYVGARRVAA